LESLFDTLGKDFNKMSVINNIKSMNESVGMLLTGSPHYFQSYFPAFSTIKAPVITEKSQCNSELGLCICNFVCVNWR
jgi:hypothetical protein